VPLFGFSFFFSEIGPSLLTSLSHDQVSESWATPDTLLLAAASLKLFGLSIRPCPPWSSNFPVLTVALLYDYFFFCRESFSQLF
jgi:hypothetical protein